MPQVQLYRALIQGGGVFFIIIPHVLPDEIRQAERANI